MTESEHNLNLRREFNRSADAGRGEGMEEDHLPIVLPVIEKMCLAPAENILEVGCGAGWLSRRLARRAPQGRVVGMDISDEMIRRARQASVEFENTLFVCGEVRQIPWSAHFFTHAISVESAYYWPDPGAGLKEIFRVLQVGGRAWLLITYYRENPHRLSWSEQTGVPIHLFSAEEWAAKFAAAGFENAVHERIVDSSPTPETYSGPWFRDAAQLREFKREGALLLSGRKPAQN